MSDDHDAGDSGEGGQRGVGESSDALKRSDPGLFVVTVKRKAARELFLRRTPALRLPAQLLNVARR